MLKRRFSAAEVAKLAGLSLATLTFFVREGILEPSLQRARGRGRGHVFDVADLVAARTLSALRYPSATAAHYKALVQFWHTSAGRELIASILRRPDRRSSRVLLLVTEGGVDVDASPLAIMKKHNTPVVHCIDAADFIDELNIASTEGLMRLDFQEPGPSGRVPTKKSRTAAKRRVLNRGEAGETQTRAPARRTKKTTSGRSRLD